jgi:hypothetical protein
MRQWPWVSREAFDAMRDARDSERETARVLRNLVVDLSAAAFRPAMIVNPLPAEPVAPKPLSPVAQIIREQTQNGGRSDTALAAHLWTYAKTLKDAGKNEDEIVGALCQWQTSELAEAEA